jgi:prolyl 4-hydroxylase
MALKDLFRHVLGSGPDGGSLPPETTPGSTTPLALRSVAALLGLKKSAKSLPGSDPAALARLGAEVSARLDQLGGAAWIKTKRVDMYAIADFMSAEECQRMIALIDADARPSTALKGKPGATVRTSHTCRLNGGDPFVAGIEQRIAALPGIDLAFSETVQGQRYHPGQYFKLHNDYIAAGQGYSSAFEQEGGQRTWTGMVYLNDVAAGGYTDFPFVPIRVAPKRGLLLLWNNIGRNGLPNLASRHAGEAVTDGNKYVLTKWFREREWQGSAASDALRE